METEFARENNIGYTIAVQTSAQTWRARNYLVGCVIQKRTDRAGRRRWWWSAWHITVLLPSSSRHPFKWASALVKHKFLPTRGWTYMPSGSAGVQRSTYSSSSTVLRRDHRSDKNPGRQKCRAKILSQNPKGATETTLGFILHIIQCCLYNKKNVIRKFFFNFFKYVCTYDFYQLSLGKKYDYYLHEGGSGSTTD